MDSFYSRSELEHIGFATIGKNVLLSRKASIYSPAMISIGDNVRIDDFCIVSFLCYTNRRFNYKKEQRGNGILSVFE